MNKYWMLALFLAAAAGWYYQHQNAPGPASTPQVQPSPHQEPRTVSLPEKPQLGVSSNWIIRSTSWDTGITAAGQIFTPPTEAPTLIRLGFQFHQYNRNGLQSDVRFQVILAEWQVDHPSPVELWASEIRTLPRIAETYKYSWQDFDVPPIKLAADREYIAWVTLSDLGNPPDTAVGIPDMGPTYRTSPVTDPNATPIHNYERGRSAFFREANPGGIRDHMTGYPWEVRDSGRNIAFRMLFAETP